MSSIKRLLRAYENRVMRERLLILATAMVLVLTVGLLAIDPLTARADQEAARVKRLRAEINQAELRIEGIQQELHRGPVVALRHEQEQLRQQLADLDLRLNAAAGRLIDPPAMVSVLEQLLRDRGDLQLLGLENDAVVALLAEDTTPVEARLYRHGFVLRIRGTYLPIVDYVSRLEAQPWPFFWDSLRYEVEAYPEATVELRVHTLSNSPEWVGV